MAQTKSPVVTILEECIALHEMKSSDYDHPTEHDGLGNFRRSTRIGVIPWIGAMNRMLDKWSRLETLTLKIQNGEDPAVKNESFEDTLMDNLVYSGIVLALYREWKASLPDGSASKPFPLIEEHDFMTMLPGDKKCIVSIRGVECGRPYDEHRNTTQRALVAASVVTALTHTFVSGYGNPLSDICSDCGRSRDAHP